MKLRKKKNKEMRLRLSSKKVNRNHKTMMSQMSRRKKEQYKIWSRWNWKFNKAAMKN